MSGTVYVDVIDVLDVGRANCQYFGPDLQPESMRIDKISDSRSQNGSN